MTRDRITLNAFILCSETDDGDGGGGGDLMTWELIFYKKNIILSCAHIASHCLLLYFVVF